MDWFWQQSAEFERMPIEIEIEYARFNQYDGLKALVEKKLAKDKFLIVEKFLGRMESKVELESSAKEEREEEGNNDNDLDIWESYRGITYDEVSSAIRCLQVVNRMLPCT